jgi:hypothetical protein
VWRWENKKAAPTESLKKLAAALNTSVSYLLGETDDPKRYVSLLSIGVEGETGNYVPPTDAARRGFARYLKSGESKSASNSHPLGETDNPDISPARKRQAGAIELKNTWEAEIIKVPVYDMRTCAGFGTSHFLEDTEIIGERLIPAYRVGAISPFDDRKPFITKVEGDSMSEADIRDGDEIVINPAEDVHSGDAALVSFGPNRDTAVKWVYFLPGGWIELRSATPGFPSLSFTKEQQESEESPLVIIGRVMAYTGVPKRG